MRRFQFSLKGLLLFTAIISALLALCVPPMKRLREAFQEASCHGLRVNMIEMALRGYHDTYGCFPPAYIPDAKGKPMHSWRVLILPFMGQQTLYEQYRFDEPWNGPNNRLLAKLTVDLYLCPLSESRDKSTTNYLAVVGPEAAWHGAQPVSRKQFADGTSQTIMVVEVADSGINWMEPRDMTFAQAAAGVNTGNKLGISSHHPDGGAHCAIDTCEELPDDIPPKLLRALLTIDGGEPAIDFFLWDNDRARIKEDWRD